MFKVEKISTTEQFGQLREEWGILLEKSRSRSIFLTWEWLFNWWKHFGSGRDLLLLLARDAENNNIAGIAPLYMENVKRLGWLNVSCVKFLGSDRVCSEFLDFIAEQRAEKEVVQSIFDYLSGAQNSFDIIELDSMEMPDNSFTRSGVDLGQRFVTFSESPRICLYLDLPQTYEIFLSRLKYNMRKKLRKLTKKINAFQGVSFNIGIGEKSVDEVIEELFTLHNARFRSRIKDSNIEDAFAGDDLKSFHRDVAAGLIEKNLLHYCVIKHDSATISSSYAFRYRDRLFLYQDGFDPAWEKFGPGTALIGFTVKTAIEMGLKEVHFLRGAEEYKFRWTDKAVKTKRIIIARKTAKCLLIVNSGRFLKNLKGLIKRPGCALKAHKQVSHVFILIIKICACISGFFPI